MGKQRCETEHNSAAVPATLPCSNCGRALQEHTVGLLHLLPAPKLRAWGATKPPDPGSTLSTSSCRAGVRPHCTPPSPAAACTLTCAFCFPHEGGLGAHTRSKLQCSADRNLIYVTGRTVPNKYRVTYPNEWGLDTGMAIAVLPFPQTSGEEISAFGWREFCKKFYLCCP